MNTLKLAEIFKKIVIQNVDADPGKWFGGVMGFEKGDFDKKVFLTAFAQAARKIGIKPVVVLDKMAGELKEAGAPFAPVGWEAAEAGRAAMMLKAVSALEDDEQLKLVQELYYRGDNREKQAVLRTLIFLPEAGRFAQVGVESCRAHVQTVFEAIACDNPYPAAYFDEMQFNQMVLKALFTGAPIERILGWEERNNEELVRMASDFAEERRAAGREVPADIQKIIDHFRS